MKTGLLFHNFFHKLRSRNYENESWKEYNYKNSDNDSNKSKFQLSEDENILSNITEGYFIIDRKGSFKYANKSFLTMIGRALPELLTLNLSNITPKKWHTSDKESMHKIGQNNELIVYEKEFIHSDGKAILVETQLSAYKRNKEKIGYSAIVRVVEKEYLVEERLKDSEGTYKEIFNSSKNLVLLVNLKTRKLIDINQTAIDSYGYTKEEMLSMPVEELSAGIPPYTKKDLDEIAEKVKREDQVSFLWRNKRKNGEFFWTQNFMKFASILGQEHLIVFSTDVSYEKEIQYELIETRQFLETAINQSPSSIIIADLQTGKIKYSNFKSFHLPELIMKEIRDNIFDILPNITYLSAQGNVVNPHQSPLIETLSKGESINNYEARIIIGNDIDFWITINAAPIKDDSGKAISCIIILSDITEKKKAELEITESKLLLETIMDTIPARVFWKDKESVFLGCNKMFLKDAGLENVNEIIGKTDYDMTWHDQAELYREDDHMVIFSGKAKLDYEEPQTTPDGDKIWLRTSKIPLRNHTGEIIGMLGTYDDITELKRNQIELENHRDHLETLVSERTKEIARINNELSNKNIELFNSNTLLVKEIEDRKNIEEKLKQSEETFRSFIEQSDQGICLVDGKGNIIEWNNAMSVFFETQREKYLNKPVWMIDQEYLPARLKNQEILNNLKEKTLGIYTNFQDNSVVYESELEVNNKTKYIQTRAFPIKTSKGRIYGRINMDITEKKVAELEVEKYKTELEYLVEERTRALKKSEAHIRLILQSVPMAFYSYDPLNKENTIWYSEQIETLSGYPKERFIKDAGFWVSKIHSEDYQHICELFQLTPAHMQESVEYRWIDASGQTIWILDQALLIESTENSSQQIIGCFWDITERKLAESSIIESERNYREIFNSSIDSIFIIDAKTNRIEDVNDTMLSMFGYDYENALKLKVEELFSNNSTTGNTFILKNLVTAAEKDMHRFEGLSSRSDGTLFWTDVILKHIALNGEDKILALVMDIDEKKKAEQQIKYRTDFEKLIFDISSRFINISNKTVDSNIVKAIKEICQFTNADAGYMLRGSENVYKYSITHYWQNENIKLLPNHFQSFSSGLSDWHTKKIKENQVVMISNIDTYQDMLPLQKSVYNDQNISSFVDVPMVYQDAVHGYFGLAVSNRDRNWSEDEISLIRATGQIFVNAIKRKESVEALIMSELSHREIYNATTEAIVVIDLKSGQIIDANRAVLEMFGLSYKDALTTSFKELILAIEEQASENVQTLIDKSLKHGPQVFEWHSKRKEGTLFWAEISIKKAEIKGVKCLLSVIRDITERKIAEENLIKNEEKYRLLIEDQTDLVIKFDNEGRLLFASPSYCDLFGKLESELAGINIMSSIHPDDNEIVEELWKNLRNTPYTGHAELRAFTQHGWRWLAWNDKAILDENDNIKEIIGVGRDITYQKGVEDALRQSEDRFRSIVQQLSDIVFIIDEEGNIKYDTPSIKNVLGYDEGFLVGKSYFEFIHPDDKKIAQDKGKTLSVENQQIALAEIRMRHFDGRWIPLETIGINMLQHPSINGLVFTCRDISERKMIEKRILDAIIKTEERERERFAKNLHDDLGPLLSSIKMYVNSFSSNNDIDKRNYIVEQLNEVVKEAITTTKEVSNDLSPHILLNYGLNSAIESFLKKVPDTIIVQFDSELIIERFANTIENSTYRIIKELVNNTLKHANAKKIQIKVGVISEYLFLEYSDDGKGFNIEDLDSIHNKGMGLSNIRSRVRSLNGFFDIATRAKKGFTCQIKIPVSQSIN